MTTFDILESNREEVLEVAERPGVASIGFFGSVARGDESAKSDIDLLVTTGSQVSPWFPAGLVLELEQLLGRHIDDVTGSGLIPMLRDQGVAEADVL